MRGYEFSGGTAVVTGAASGIGEALAVQLADRGSALALVDRDGETPEQLRHIEEWLREEHPFLLREQPWEHATVVLAGSPVVDDAPPGYVVIAPPVASRS